MAVATCPTHDPDIELAPIDGLCPACGRPYKGTEDPEATKAFLAQHHAVRVSFSADSPGLTHCGNCCPFPIETTRHISTVLGNAIVEAFKSRTPEQQREWLDRLRRKDRPELAHACPYCGAERGDWCVVPKTGARAQHTHADRLAKGDLVRAELGEPVRPRARSGRVRG